MELDQDTINDILEMLAQLTPREEQILKMIYGLVEKRYNTVQ
jgi:DNA-directed RNA polymerase sigma subunit (sigma70/sigma32)